VVTPVCLAGIATLVAACVSYAQQSHSPGGAAGVAALFLGMVVAERFPVPVEGVDAGGVTLGFVFAVAAIVLFGWQAGVIVAAGGPTVTHLLGHRPLLRVAYNGSMFALSAVAAGLAIGQIAESSIGTLIARVALAAFLYNWVVNLVLISVVLSATSGKPFVRIICGNARQTTAPFALMASSALMLVVLWERSPALSLALVGPLLAIGLYQRSTFAALKAMRLALTDPLTGLGNHRNFHERLQRELAQADDHRRPLSLCLVDIDDFKGVNDRYGHPVGDRVLAQVASRLRQGGESFRLGGDEFAVLLPGLDASEAVAVARSIVERVGAVQVEPVGSVTVSAGVATYPVQGVGRDELIRLADSALYWAKEDGKNRAQAYERELAKLEELQQIGDGADRAVRYRAATGLVKAVDARDAYTGSHSERVGELAARIARRLGDDEAEVELMRLAASLHDLGKVAIPEEILRKPGALDESERLVMQRHPQIGFRMLESLGVERVADWVLHHHERWDGNGYPHRLRGEEIPLGARIILVADAYDAMTSERVYCNPVSPQEAFAELGRCSGSQFDPAIVDAFAEELGVSAPAVELAS
jgi:diguanylate cyclase (GGDEF)-like protein/putative nucleotidyltransferase with HDIG domain